MAPADIAAIVEQIAALKARRDAVLAPDPYADRSNPGAYAEAGDLTSEIAALERKRADLEAQRKADLAKLHIARKELALDEETWAALVLLISGGRAASSGELTAAERAALVAALKAGGWKPRPGKAAKARLRATAPSEPKEALAGKIRALLLDGGRDDRYADAIASKRFGVSRWEWLGYAETLKLAQMLQIDATRRARRQRVER